jgi:phosphoenolpyruvate carboxykinase (ATP)
MSGMAGHPKNVIFLTADAFGVLPPIARLSREQAQYYFLSGYTAKIAGTEKGVTEPEPNFSTCFAAPFLALPPVRYARMLGERLERHGSRVWLINTGWTGGPYGTGSRINIADTRTIVRAVLTGVLDSVPTYRDETFGLDVPQHVPGVPDEVLHPRQTWQDQAGYDVQARRLAQLFRENFETNFAGQVSEGIKASGPR